MTVDLIDDLDRVLLIELILSDLTGQGSVNPSRSPRRKRLLSLLETLEGVDTRLFVERQATVGPVFAEPPSSAPSG